MAVVGTNVTAANYNTIQGKIDDVLGAGDGAQNGYGQSLQSSQKSAGDVIAATDMQQLYNDLIKARLHQTNPVTWSNADGLAAPSAAENVGASAADIGDETPLTIFSLVASTEYMIVDTGDSDFTLIGASANEAGIKFTATGPGTGTGIAKLSPTSANAEDDQAEGYLDFEAAADEIVADINQHDADNFTISTVTSTRTNPWGGGDFASPGSKITNEVEITWLNSDQRRYFFNTGGEIRFNADLTGAVTANSKEDNWNTVLANMGTITFGKSATTADGSSPGSGSAIGNYYADWNLTSSSNRAVIYIKNGSGIYADIQYRIEAWEVAAGDATTPSTLRFRIEFQDNDYSSSPSDVDEYIDNDIESNVKIYHDTVLGIPAPSLTTITALDDGIQNSVSANLTRNPATGSIDEGESVTFTLSVNPSANGTTIDYTLSGVGISVGDLDNSQGMGGVFTINNGIGSVTITAKNDETSEGAETLTCSVPAFGLQQSIQINDTSTSPSPPVVNTYNITGPSSINEGSTGTYNVTTNDNDGTYYYSVSPTGVMTTNNGSFSVTGGNGSFNLTAANDAVVGDNETITVSFRTGGVGGTIVDSMSTSIVDTTVPARTENLYAIEYYALADLDAGGMGNDAFQTYGTTQNRTRIVSANSVSRPSLQNISETRYYGGFDTGYTWAKQANDNRIDIAVVGGGGGGAGVSVDSSREGPASGGGAGGVAFKTLLDGNIPNTANIIVGRGGDGSRQEGGSNDYNLGRAGGISTFSYSSTIDKYSFTFGKESFVMQGTNLPSVWVWEGNVIRTAINDFAGSFVYNGVTYERGTQEASFNWGSNPLEPELAFYYRIKRAGGTIDAGPGQNSGFFGVTDISGVGGLGGPASGGDSNFVGAAGLNTLTNFNTLRSSTGGTISTGDGIQANLPDGDTLPASGTLADENVGNRVKEGARTNISANKILLQYLEVQGGTAACQIPNYGTYCNGLGVGAGGGGMSQRQQPSRGGAGHPGVVAIARYSSTEPAKSINIYTANGVVGITTSFPTVYGAGWNGSTIGTNTNNFTTTSGSHSLVSAVITRIVSAPTGTTNMSGIMFFVEFKLSGNVPFERLHSVDVSQGTNRNITFVKTQRSARGFDGTNTTFTLSTQDGLPPLVTSDDSNGFIWVLNQGNWNFTLRTFE
jgi:hypothetical protein